VELAAEQSPLSKESNQYDVNIQEKITMKYIVMKYTETVVDFKKSSNRP